ncbi:MAG: ThuA domain-containing protein, partial [Lentisphaeria bacterium]|nr:ThuA domain-containing protein [Lentisphaeria bacterium]
MTFASPAVILIDPVLPVWLIALIVLGAGYGAYQTYRYCTLAPRQRWLLWSLRMGAVLIIAWLLLQAHRRVTHTVHENPVLAVALDVSASMRDNPSQAKKSRAKRAANFLQSKKFQRLTKGYRTYTYLLGSELEESGDEVILFNAPRSHIGSCLNQMVERLRAENLGGIVLLSDGLDQSGERLTPQTLGVPIFIPELEEPFERAEDAGQDFAVADVSYPKMMVVNWRASVEVVVRRRGSGTLSFPIHLRQGGKLQRTSMVEFGEEESFKQIAFSVEPADVGQLLYQVEIAPPEDTVSENNRRDFLIEVTDPKNRVLYLEGAPRWEFKFLKRALLSEKNYQLSAFVRGGDGSFINFDEMSGQAGGESPTFSTESLAEYRVVILGDMPGSALTKENCKNLRDFVDKGGGLLVIGAARSYGQDGLIGTPSLGEVLPAKSVPGARMKEGRFTVALTPAGRTHPALGDLALETRIPLVLSFWSPVEVGGFASVLIATADGSPVLVTRRFGQGRVAMVFSDSLWRWQLGGGGGGAEKSLYNKFVTQLVYWLAPSEKDVEKTTVLQAVVAKNEVELREKVIIGAVFDSGDEGGGVSCRITTPENKHLVIPMMPSRLGTDLGLSRGVDGFRCFFTPQQSGKFQVVLTTADGTQETSIILLATEPENEKTGASVNREYLQQLAQDTSGKFVKWSDRHSL